ncbi:putative transmembrane protein 217B isoform X2 [Dasypus novemcinctus]|uniref:putative transmembrane protein 217B isoform X2 n=1 Tax=Dasypus novemcinctus TaxID=9361 RepID=UPI000328F281|nr:putative transmembrane protein 217B isoform X2 [Dasypus novemcinctus]
MSARKYSFVVGIFSVLNTVQFLIFELYQVTFIGFEEDRFSIYIEKEPGIVSWILVHRDYISHFLSVTTILVSCFLLYCIYMNVHVGLMIYAMWIFPYEIVSFSMVLLINRNTKEQFKELRYLNLIFQVSRMLLHFCSLPYVIKHAYFLYKDHKAASTAIRHRRSSISTVDSWSPVRLGAMYPKFS